MRNLDENDKKEDVHIDGQGPLLTTAHLQISHADVIVINKSDLVSVDDMQSIKERIQAINGLAKIHVAQQARIPRLGGYLLDLHAYDDVGVLDVTEKGHSHLDSTISTVTVTVPVLKLDQLLRVDAWLRSILWESRLPGVEIAIPSETQYEEKLFEIHRLKGSLIIDDGSIKVVQGVREIFEIKDAPWKKEYTVTCAMDGKLVFIGRNIERMKFGASLISAIERP